MDQFYEVQNNFNWMKKAYFYYTKKNASRYGLKPIPSPSLKKKILPHIIFYGILIAVIFLGIVTNSGQIGGFFGALTGFCIDPLILIGGIVVGIAARNQFVIFIGAIIVEIIALIMIFNLKISIGSSYSFFSAGIMYIAILAWAYLSNLLIQIKRN